MPLKKIIFWYNIQDKKLLSVLYHWKKIFGYNIKMLEITIDNCHKCHIEAINEIIVNIFGLIGEIQKLKANVTGKLFLISIKSHRVKNIEKD